MRTKPLSAALAIVLLAALSAFAWYALRDQEEGSNEQAARVALPGNAAEASAEERPAADLVGTEVETPSGPEAAAAALEAGLAAAESADAATRRLLEGDDPRVVLGHVVLPSGTPADEQLFVFAFDTKKSRRELARSPAIAAAWGEPSARSAFAAELVSVDEAVEEIGPAVVESVEADAPASEREARTTPETQTRRGIGGELTHAQVDADGRFRLLVPGDAESVHLAVAGRYLYSESTQQASVPMVDAHLAAQLGCWITGELVAAAGVEATDDDFAGVEVELFPDIEANFDPMALAFGGSTHKTRTNDAGAFALRGVSDSFAYGLLARTERLAMAIENGISMEAGEHVVKQLSLRRGATVRGKVVDDAGNPVEDVEVQATRPGIIGDILNELREADTDAEGRFELAGLPDGAIQLAAEERGYTRSEENLEEPVADGDVVEGIVLELDRGGVLSGVVRFPDGSFVENANVSASIDMSVMATPEAMNMRNTEGGSARTDASGRYELTGLAGGPFQVTAVVRPKEGERTGVWRAKESKVRLNRGSLDLELARLGEVTGRVIDLAGEPVPSFTIDASLDGSGGMFGLGAERQREAYTEREDGTFTLDELEPGSWTVHATGEGFGRSEEDVIVVPPSGAMPVIELVLPPAASVAGHVVDAAGAPVSGARVSLSLELGAMMEQAFGGQMPSAVSDEEGAFVLEGLDPGNANIVAEADGAAASEPMPVELAPGAIVDDVVLVVRLGGRIVGLVVDDDGEPMSGRRIIAQRPPDFARQRFAQTDGEGRFDLEHLEPGRWQLTSIRDFFADDSASEAADDGEAMANLLEGMQFEFVEVIDGETVEVNFGLTSGDAVHVRARVLAGEEPVEGAMVTLVPENSAGAGGLAMKITDAQGWIDVDLRAPGPHLVTVQKNVGMGRQNSVEFLETVPEGEDYEFTLQLPLGSIHGRVYGPDGKPLGGCRVTLNVEDGVAYASVMGGNYAELVTDEDGRYEIDSLRPGSYSVAAGGSALGGMFGDDAVAGRVVRGGVRVSEGRVTDGIDFRLEEPGKITGVVRDAAAKPVSGVAVFVRDERGFVLERFSFVTTDAAGRFEYSGVQAGTYFVSAHSGDVASRDSDPVRVRAGETAEASLRVEPGTVLLVTVIDTSGEEVRGRVQVKDPNGVEMTGMLSFEDIMDSFGSGFSTKEQRVGPLAPGTYEVTVTAPDGRTASKPVTLDGRPERKLKVRLR